MAKYKYLRGGRVFESDKKYNLPQIGIDGKLVTPSKRLTDPKIDPKKPPVFKTQEEHDAYHRKLLLEKAKLENANMYGAFEQGKVDENSLIATMGGLPKYAAKPTNNNFDGSKSRIKNVAFKPQPTEGYRYDKGLPDKESITKSGYEKGGFASILGSTAPFLDNIANLVATNKTPNIPQPVLTNAPRLATKLNIAPQQRRIENDTKAAGMGIDRSTSSAGVANANKGSLLANKFRAIGDLEANKQNFEAEQGNRQAGMDFQAQSNNNQLINQRNTMQMMRTDDVNSRYASVLSDFGSDIANINREKNMMSRDKDAFRTLMKVSPDVAYQFADTDMFGELFKNDEPGLRKLILSNQGTAQRAKLTAAYKKLFNRDFTD